jgi:solute carrier family 25 protein 38
VRFFVYLSFCLSSFMLSRLFLDSFAIFRSCADYRRKISTTLKEVVRDDGILGLWRGTIPTLVRYVSVNPYRRMI